MTTSLRAGRAARRRSRVITISVLSLILAALVATALMVGETFYPPGDVIAVIAGERVPGASYTVGELRLPRTALAVVAGASFGVSGVVFQTMLRNQLASPDIIGISSGAGAAGVVGIVFFHLNQATVSLLALLAALLVAALIYALSLRSGFAGTRLILIGIGVAALLQSVVTYTLSRAAAWDLPTATRWLTGSLNAASWTWVVPVAITAGLMIPLIVVLSHRLSVLRMGDDLASALGIPVTATRITIIIAAVALIAVATAACGPIAFVAFMSGPIAMRLIGPGASPIAAAALVGALLVLGADLLGQFALGTRYPVGVITGILGAPYLIFLLIRSQRTGGAS
ncbi:FecCD family ABC transporter permease [Corynebacterium testudinoris]|uniref:ABC-type enterobactin transport system, permease component n=1 Tax=Corynebacterium testudinoris TaxID=136857 RepID=A0A0G3H3L2_9CORY|nr:iron chelate uptake ABC transporter family permease subunit [Corynebacterium testudinoris]AKK07989.1 ABC-type enterobactin transport system, permease component [Corynebacterium testudinoris]